MTILTEKSHHSEIASKLEIVKTYQQKGQLDEALDYAIRLLSDYPQDPQILITLGLLELNSNRPKLALNYFELTVKYSPQDAIGYHFLGIAYCHLSQLEKGIECFKKALGLNPNLGETLFNLAIALINLSQLSEAEDYLEKSKSANFNSPALYYNLGYIAHKKDDFEKAIQNYQQALKLAPKDIKCAVNLAEALLQANRLKEARIQFFSLLDNPATHKLAHKKIGIINLLQGKHQKALVHFKKGFIAEEEDIYFYLERTYKELNQHSQRHKTLIDAIKKFPNNTYFLTEALYITRTSCIWTDLDYLQALLKESSLTDEYFSMVGMHYIFNFNLQEELIFSRKVANYFKHKVAETKKEANFTFSTSRREKIRVGYLSGNVKNHPNARMVANIFSHHSREKFEFFLYSTSKTDDSNYAKKLISTVDHFIDLTLCENLLECAHKINVENEIDILVDISGYFHALSAKILALKPAKIQIGYLDHCGSRGADFIDYSIVDKVVTPFEDAQFYDEKLIFLPNTLFISDKENEVESVSRSTFGLPEDKFIFTCFNSSLKYDPKTFSSWMKILAATPNSVLLLWAVTTLSQTNLKRYAQEQQIDPERILFAEAMPREKHFERLKTLDLFLDCFTCSAHSTALDAIWSELPLLTLYGKNVAQRGASSILSAIDLKELIAYSVEEYEEKAIALANNPVHLQSLRQKIAINKHEKPLFDMKLTTTNLEYAYEHAYNQYLAGEEPQHILYSSTGN